MTGTTPTRRLRPGGWRLTAIVLLGPLVGAFVVLLFMLAGQLPDLSPQDAAEMSGFVLGIGWFMGLVPAALAALVVRLLGLARGRMHRLAEALAMGGLSATLAMPIILPVLFGIAVPPLEIVLLFVVCGAIAFCATALPGLGDL